MKLRNLFFAAAALTVCGTAAAADYPWYVGAAATEFTAEANSMPTYVANGFMTKFGVDMGRYVAVELHYGESAEVSKYTDSGVTSKFTAKQVGAAFLRGNLNFEKIRIYAVAGYAAANVRARVGTLSDTETVHSPAYGFGIELYGNERAAIYLESMRYINGVKTNFKKLGIDQRGNLTTLDAGLVYHF